MDQLVDNACPQCVQDGCGLEPVFSCCSTGLEAVTPAIECFADVTWCLGSPLAFPIIFCFDPETTETGGWKISMLETPARRPIECCLSTLCPPCAQWYMRREALGRDMTKYKLWQGYHDGPQCCARACPGAPIVIESGTYGESDCPEVFLCLEVWCLAGMWSTCCAFNVTRRLVKEERGLGDDPTEIRQEKCVSFFQGIANQLWCLSCCVSCTGCWVGICAQDSAGAQEFSQSSQACSNQCFRIVWTIWKGIYSVKIIAMGCMTGQMLHETSDATPLTQAPKSNKMDRGDNQPSPSGGFADALDSKPY